MAAGEKRGDQEIDDLRLAADDPNDGLVQLLETFEDRIRYRVHSISYGTGRHRRPTNQYTEVTSLRSRSRPRTRSRRTIQKREPSGTEMETETGTG